MTSQTVEPTAPNLSKKDALIAGLMGLAALGLYLATLFPGLTDIGDASKFEFVGHVLGIPHAPGYPLYVMVSHVFSELPWGTLAYRMNALSALFGAIAVALGYLLGRQVGARPAVAAAAALALACGNAFWAKSLYAKGYTLNAALVSAGILFVLRWGRSRRTRDLYWAMAIFAVSLGNHLTVLAVLPVLVLYALVTDARTALRPRTLLVLALLVAGGFSQYLLILIRTRQHAPYVEAPASTLPQLWAVMTARRFAHEIGAYSPSALLLTRGPLVAGLIHAELGAIGVVLLLVGLAVLARRRWRDAMLLGLGALGVAALTSTMGSGEDQGFLLPTFVLSWPLVALGLDTVVAAGGRIRPWLGVGVAVAAFGLPLGQVVHNVHENDHHGETFETAYFNALFAALPAKTAIVRDEYRINMMVLYKLLGEHADGARDIQLIPAERGEVDKRLADGFEVLAFRSGQQELAGSGVVFEPFAPPSTPGALALFRQRPVFQAVSVPPCFDIANRDWVNLGTVAAARGRLSVRLDDFHPFDARLTAYVASDRRLDPMLAGASGAGTPVLNVDSYETARAEVEGRLAAQIASDHVSLPADVRQAPFVTRVDVHVNDKGAYSLFGLDLGPDAGSVVARAVVDHPEPRRAHVCWHPLAGVDAWPQGQPSVTLPPNASVLEFDDGWSPVEFAPNGDVFRWTSNRAIVVVPLDHPRAAVVRIPAYAMEYPGRAPAEVTMTVNGHRLGHKSLPSGGAVLEWTVPAADWRRGLNIVVFDVAGAARPSDVEASPDHRLLGMNIRSIELEETK